MIWFYIPNFSDRLVYALLYALCAATTALVIHALVWARSMGLDLFFNPDTLATMVGPAVLPSLACAALFIASARFAEWRWVLAATLTVFVMEQVVFWAWYSTIDDPLGFALAFIQMPILGGLLLAPLVFGFVSIWKRS